MSFLEELKRRNVFRVGIAYLVVAWLVLQITDVVAPTLELPDIFNRGVLFSLAIGFPIALIFAWAFELTPEGVKKEREVDRGASIAKVTGRKLDFAIIGLLAIAVGVLLVDNYVRDDFDSGPSEGIDLFGEGTAPSIAVLPFADMSPNGDQEYFGDGMAEELLNELVRLDGLRVAGRTSSFSFKGTNANHAMIAEALNVATILEGSIRKDGDTIRITAQLINASDGYHLWSDTYDRDLENIFAIQEEIATSVAGVLGVRLGVGGVNAFQGAGTTNIEAYESYLEATAVRVPPGEAIPLLERATQLDPDYAAAWAELGVVTASTQWISSPEQAPAIKERAYVYVRRAIDLDPESAAANSLLGTVLYARKDWIAGEEAHMKALSLRADHSALAQHGNLLMRTGRLTDALREFDASQSAESLRGRPALHRWHINVAQGQLTLAKQNAAWFPQERSEVEIALNTDNEEEIRALLSAMPPTNRPTTALYDPVLKDFNSPEKVLSYLRLIYADDNTQWPSKLHDIALLAAYFGDPEFALQTFGEETRNTSVRLQAAWYPVMSEVRKLPAFKDLVTDLNLVAYWRANGWADMCRPLGDNDFECN